MSRANATWSTCLQTIAAGLQAGSGAGYFQDGDFGGVFARRLAPLAVLDIDGDGSIAAWIDGLLILRFMFGFGGASLVSGAIGPGCTRCSAPAIESYLASLT
jgi:hypothetical protein